MTNQPDVNPSHLRRAGGAALGAAALLAAVTLPAATAAASSAPRAAVARPEPPTTGTHVLTDALVPGLGDASLVTDLGALPASSAFQVSVHIAEDQSAEAAEFAAITNPKSPDYGHYLSVAQYVAAFGEPVAVTDAVASQLSADGLAVVYRNAPGTLLELSGTAAQMEATFHTPIDAFAEADGRTFRANTAEPTVPAAVDAIDMLETASAPTTQQACAPGEPGVTGCTGAITPQDLWSVYDQPATDEGAGQQIGIIGDGQADTVISDLRGFEGVHGLRQVPVRVVDAADTYTYSAAEGEWALDSAATTGMAPQIDGLNYYFGDTLGDDTPLAAFADDDTPGAPTQANYSVGGCESLDYALGTITTEEPIFRQMAMEGKTLFASTGDTGGSCTVVTGNGFLNTGAPMVEWPASSDAVVGVGGTTLYTNGAEPDPSRVLENAWTYTGGGSSDYVQEPSWQSGVDTIDVPCIDEVVTSTGGGAECKGLPDVAALSGDISLAVGDTIGDNQLSQGYTDFEGATETSENPSDVTPGSATVDGGTSLASPLWVGMWTRIQAAHGGGLGFAAPQLYSVGENPTEDASDFYDITVGSNGQQHAQARSALDPTGWDYVSGLGVPVVSDLMTTLDGTTTDPSTVEDGQDGTVTVVSAATTSPVACTQNGVITATPDDVSPTAVAVDKGAVDLVQTTLTEPTPGTIASATQVQDLTDSTDSLVFTTTFTYDGGTYELTAERDEPGGDETFDLDSVTGASSETGATITTLATLQGSFDDASDTVTVDMPISTFDSTADPSTDLADGASLTGLSETSNTVADDEIDYDDQASTPCPYVVGAATGPSPALPEAPYLPLLLLGFVPAGLYLARRRRRGGPTAA